MSFTEDFNYARKKKGPGCATVIYYDGHAAHRNLHRLQGCEGAAPLEINGGGFHLKRLPRLVISKPPLEICGDTLILRQGIIRYTVMLADILWFHTHIFTVRHSDRRTVRVILKNKRQRLITLRLEQDIRPALQTLRRDWPHMLITVNRGDEYKKYMALYRKDFSKLLETVANGGI